MVRLQRMIFQISIRLLPIGRRDMDTRIDLMRCFKNIDIVAEPHSVARCLPQCANDVRVPEKLVDGVNVTDDPRHFWLAPIFSDMVRHCAVRIASHIFSVRRTSLCAN